jgi:hypothetical protein
VCCVRYTGSNENSYTFLGVSEKKGRVRERMRRKELAER